MNLKCWREQKKSVCVAEMCSDDAKSNKLKDKVNSHNKRCSFISAAKIKLLRLRSENSQFPKPSASGMQLSCGIKPLIPRTADYIPLQVSTFSSIHIWSGSLTSFEQ